MEGLNIGNQIYFVRLDEILNLTIRYIKDNIIVGCDTATKQAYLIDVDKSESNIFYSISSAKKYLNSI